VQQMEESLAALHEEQTCVAASGGLQPARAHQLQDWARERDELQSAQRHHVLL
jgi:hypothetical protein